jgi:hypothetical protein
MESREAELGPERKYNWPEDAVESSFGTRGFEREWS